jgi:hypothetical protein
VRGCASTTHTARALEFGPEAATIRGFRVVAWMNVFMPLAPLLIFINHANRLPRRRSISTIIRLGSNTYGP